MSEGIVDAPCFGAGRDLAGAEVLRIGAPRIGDEECAAATAVLRSGALAQGVEVAAFEAAFSERVARRECVAVNSGTSALLLGLLALGIGPGDEVVVPSFSFAATANAVVLAGATPVFADIDLDHYALDPAAVRAALGPRTAAVVPVHLYGRPAPMGELVALADEHGLAVVEDCAQAHLASVGGVPVGALGDVGAFSFYPTKNMTTGEGGLVSCADPATARRIRLLRNQGMERRYENEVVGYNLRMTEVQAAIGRVQLRKLGGWTETRRRQAGALGARIQQELAGPGSADVVLPGETPGTEAVWHQYTVRVDDRDRVVRELDRSGVVAGVYYPTPIHRLPAYDRVLDLPATARACAQVLSLPAGPGLGPEDLDRVAGALAAAVRR